MQRYFIVLMISIVVISCSKVKHDPYDEKLNKVVESIDELLSDLKAELKATSIYAESLYIRQNEILPTIDRSKYAIYDKSIFYKKKQDLGSAVFVTGFHPIDDSLKRTVYFTEPLDKAFLSIVEKYPQIIQVYYNDRRSYNRIYPWFDVLTQYQRNVDLTQFNFYFLADLEHNPLKKSICVDDPYLDPAGRGWIYSIISPVYYKDKLEGVLGVDLTAEGLLRYLSKDDVISCMIVQNNGTIIASSEDLYQKFNLPNRDRINYIERIAKDEHLKDDFSLQTSKSLELRELYGYLQKDQVFTKKLFDKEYVIYVKSLKEINWKLIFLRDINAGN